MKRIRNVRFYRYDKWRMEMNGGKSCDSSCAISVFIKETEALRLCEKLQKNVFTYSPGFLYNSKRDSIENRREDTH